jgi:hypothetical protein
MGFCVASDSFFSPEAVCDAHSIGLENDLALHIAVYMHLCQGIF